MASILTCSDHCTVNNVFPLQVPGSNGAASALADFLVAKDASTGTFVIEDPTDNVRGLIAVNTGVDAAVLLQHFDLAAYDGLLPADDYAALAAEAEAVLAADSQAVADAKHAQLVVRLHSAWCFGPPRPGQSINQRPVNPRPVLHAGGGSSTGQGG